MCTYQESRGGFPLIIFLSLRVSLVVAVRSGRKAAKWKINWCLYLQSCKRGQCHNSLLLLPLPTWISKIDYNKHRLGNPQKWNCQLFSLLGKKYVKLEVFLHIPVLSNIQAMRTYALRRSKIRVKHSLLNIAIYLEWVLPMQSLSIQRSRKTRLGLWDPICLLRPFLLYHFSNPFLCICLYLIYQLGMSSKKGYFTVRLTVRVDPPSQSALREFFWCVKRTGVFWFKNTVLSPF